MTTSDNLCVSLTRFILALVKELALRNIPTSTNFRLLREENHRYGVLLDLLCEGATETLEQTSEQNLFHENYEWLLLHEGFETSEDIKDNNSLAVENEIFEMMGDFNVSFNSRVTILHLEESEHSFYDLHKVGNGTDLICRFPDQFIFTDELYDIHLDILPRLHYSLLVNLIDQLNVTIDLRFVYDYGWINESTGLFDGYMGLFQDGQIEIGTSGVIMREDRYQVIDYTVQIYPLESVTIFRQPSLASVSNIFALPFATSVWLSILGFCLMAAVFFYQQLFAGRRYDFEHGYPHAVSPIGVGFLILGIMCQQGVSETPTSLSSRCTLLMTLIASLLCYTTYSAHIVALLQSPSHVIQNAEDLLQSPLSMGVGNATNFNRIYLQESNETFIKALYDIKIKPQGEDAYRAPAEGIAKVRTELYAFQLITHFAYRRISDTYTEGEKCALHELHILPFPILAIPVKKYSPYKEIVGEKVLWQRETGVTSRIGNLWIPPKPNCDAKVGAEFASVKLSEFLFPLKLIGTGFLLAIFIFLLELIYHQHFDGSLERNTLSQENLIRIHGDQQDSNLKGFSFGRKRAWAS
nr:PREDICTED: glutamate receptor ionotropic, kainate 5-like [Bemisia tabaci]